MSDEGKRPDSKPKLSAKDVSIINVAVAAAQNQSSELSTEIERALRNGVTPDEIRAILDEIVLLVGDRVVDSIQAAGQTISEWEQ
jgi:4-carboxymuconolactone decarboxylase